MDTSQTPRAPSWWLALEARLPPVLQGGRVTPTRATAVALVLLAVVVGGGVTLLAMRGRDRSVSVTGSPGSGGQATSAGTHVAVPTPSRTGLPDVVVEVVGKVLRPGVVRLPAGSRVADAVEACGGVLPGLSTDGLGLAQKLVDGEQIRVDLPGPAPAPAAPATEGDVGPLNINTATEAQFDALPGVGPVLAGRIIAYRTAHGQFSSVDQLAEVQGMGEKKFADLKPLVTV